MRADRSRNATEETDMPGQPRYVMVRNFEVRKTRTQENFGSLRLNLGRAGDFAEIDAKIWELDAWVGSGRPLPAVGDLIEVIDPRESEYQGRRQWILQAGGVRVLAGEERERCMAEFVPPVRIDRAFYQRRLDALIDMTDGARACGMVLRAIFDSAGFREAFCSAPAALRHHQSYPGGLLEHTINVTELALAIADRFEGTAPLTYNTRRLRLDRQVLVAAGLLHDIGKIETYRMSPLPEVTDCQSWEGHLAVGYARVRTVADPLLTAPPYPGARDELHRLFHCILAHHGRLEFGSPVDPCCAEAFILSQADLSDV